MTVPTGTPSASAIAGASSPTRCRTTTARCCSGSAARARSASTAAGVGPGTLAGGPWRSAALMPFSAFPAAVADLAQRDLADPRLRVVVPRDLRPCAHQPDEGVLHGLLRLVPVAADRSDDADEPGVGRGVQLAQVLGLRHPGLRCCRRHAADTHEPPRRVHRPRRDLMMQARRLRRSARGGPAHRGAERPPGSPLRAARQHTGDLLGAPGTGRELEVHGATFMRFEDGAVAERGQHVDDLGMMQQLGRPLRRPRRVGAALPRGRRTAAAPTVLRSSGRTRSPGPPARNGSCGRCEQPTPTPPPVTAPR